MAARKKMKKKPAAKGAKKVNKSARKPAAKKARVKTARAPARKKPAAKKSPARKPARAKAAPLAPGSMLIHIEPALLERLQHLAGGMFKSVEEIIPQALGEFADNWEDHARTVEILNSGSDRVALVVPQDEEKTD